jgi:hypothetical protein
MTLYARFLRYLRGDRPNLAEAMVAQDSVIDVPRPDAEDIGFRGITSRYTESSGVELDEAEVPEGLRHLIPFAKHWCIGDDRERSDLMWLTPAEDLSSFVAAVWPVREEIERWSRSRRQDIPVPDEVIAFDQMMQAVAEAVALFTEAPDETS